MRSLKKVNMRYLTSIVKNNIQNPVKTFPKEKRIPKMCLKQLFSHH